MPEGAVLAHHPLPEQPPAAVRAEPRALVLNDGHVADHESRGYEDPEDSVHAEGVELIQVIAAAAVKLEGHRRGVPQDDGRPTPEALPEGVVPEESAGR